jgi:Flp pilus assembly protein TadG
MGAMLTKLPGGRHLADERGAVVPLVAICLVALLSATALAVDMGLLFNARGEAQRAADAAALAGASTWMEPTPSTDSASARAQSYAGRNQILGQSIHPAEVAVTIDAPNKAVTVRITRSPLPLFFARVFGRRSASVQAQATARVHDSGTAACIKPFGLPNNAYSSSDVGRRVLIWESGNNANDPGATQFVLVGNQTSPNGVGHDVFYMLTDNSCANNRVEVGGSLPVQPSNNTQGNVDQALRDIRQTYGTLTWTADGPYDGFSKPDWNSDPRVALIPLYPPGSVVFPGSTTATVTGFIRVVIDSNTTNCKAGTANPCVYATNNGQHEQLYATILPANGISDTCVGTGCAQLNRALQLVQ